MQSENSGSHHPEGPNNSSGSKFMMECVICYGNIQDAVVTQCGHMYCWKCLSEWMDRGNKTCPVCKGAVTEETVIPVYMPGDSSTHSKFKARPTSKRVDAEGSDQGNPPFMFSFGIGLFPFSVFLPFLNSGNYDARGAPDEPELTPTRRLIRQMVSNCLLILVILSLSSRLMEW